MIFDYHKQLLIKVTLCVYLFNLVWYASERNKIIIENSADNFSNLAAVQRQSYEFNSSINKDRRLAKDSKQNNFFLLTFAIFHVATPTQWDPRWIIEIVFSLVEIDIFFCRQGNLFYIWNGALWACFTAWRDISPGVVSRLVHIFSPAFNRSSILPT